MKKRILCFAGVMVMSLAMATTAFAAKKGDVDGDGILTSGDSQLIMQYVLNNSFDFGLQTFDVSVADYDGDNIITANDAAMVHQEVLKPTFFDDTYLDITMPSGQVVSVLFDYKDTDKVIDVVDEIVAGGQYDSAISNRLAAINSRIDNFKISGATGVYTLRDAQGWDKLTQALAPITADTTALANMKLDDYTDLAELKAIYANAKLAFTPASLTESNIQTTVVNARAILGDRTPVIAMTSEKTGDMTPDATLAFALTNKLNEYDTVTVGQVKDLFGNSASLTVGKTTVKVDLVTR